MMFLIETASALNLVSEPLQNGQNNIYIKFTWLTMVMLLRKQKARCSSAVDQCGGGAWKYLQL